MLRAVWSRPRSDEFERTYSRLLVGELPPSSPQVRISGSFERVRGRRFVVDLNILDWIRLGRSTEREKRQTVSVTPEGKLLVETTETLKKSSYHWDEAQFFHLVRRETADQEADFTRTYGREKRFSREGLRQIFTMALQCGIMDEFRLPSPSEFPLKAQVLLVTRFSRQGLARVRRASRKRRWEALVQALELAEPDRYGRKIFRRDWIDVREVRERIDEDPAQAHLVTHYPVGGRSRFERIQVVAAYRRAKRFLSLLEHWRKGEYAQLFQAFQLGMDVPVYFFPPALYA